MGGHQVAVDWVTKTLKPHTEHLKRFALLADNLTGQIHEDLKKMLVIALVLFGMDCQVQQIFGNQSMLDMVKCSKLSWNKNITDGWMTKNMLIDGMEMKTHIQQKKDEF